MDKKSAERIDEAIGIFISNKRYARSYGSKVSETLNNPQKTLRNQQIVDWNGCLILCGGKEKDLRDILVLCVNDLLRSQTVIRRAYLERNSRTMHDELHRIIGGLCYLKLPELSRAVNAFYRAVKNDTQRPKELAMTYQVFEQASKRFHEYYVKHLAN